uniref:C-type lectin domain-containing protein n=1 Tax=Cyprinus carpio TaxID=7962 RepID=A0A8C2ATE8_CYPCA
TMDSLFSSLEQLNTVDFPAAGILSKASCDLDRIILIKEPKTWTEAQSYCREKYKDLVTVQNDTENTFLANILSVKGQNDAWFGLYKNPWQWSDNSSVSWSSVKWESGQPNNVKGIEDCVKAKKKKKSANGLRKIS